MLDQPLPLSLQVIAANKCLEGIEKQRNDLLVETVFRREDCAEREVIKTCEIDLMAGLHPPLRCRYASHSPPVHPQAAKTFDCALPNSFALPDDCGWKRRTTGSSSLLSRVISEPVTGRIDDKMWPSQRRFGPRCSSTT